MVALRVEFLKVRARAMRFGEEVQLLQEEQRRVLVSLERDALEWERRILLAEHKECVILRQGVVAYAARQRDLLRGLQARFRRMWTGMGLAGGEPGQPDGNVAGPGLWNEDKELLTLEDDSDNDEQLIALPKHNDSDDDL